MKKHYFLGLDENKKQCIVLSSLASYSMLKRQKNNIVKSDFNGYWGTNWCGHDKIERTLSIINCSIIDDHCIELPSMISFTGIDDDCGHEYFWRFDIKYIVEIKNG